MWMQVERQVHSEITRRLCIQRTIPELPPGVHPRETLNDPADRTASSATHLAVV